MTAIYDGTDCTTTTVLLSCPFCGGAPYAYRAVNGTEMFHVGCSACGVDLKAAWYREDKGPTRDIVTAWNTRVSSDSRTNNE